ncbi:MAG: hypothetical protein ACD_57C00007G0003 [uncultured bacterium]|nr:MAG: hypothetical protein ACD_57C00007G0003 [uncultured bacterium]
MKKRRTRRQKESAKHNVTVNWNEINLENPSKSRLTEASVKGQKKDVIEAKPKTKANDKNANYMDKDASLRSIKLDLVKSILISILIVSIELVLYLTRV